LALVEPGGLEQHRAIIGVEANVHLQVRTRAVDHDAALARRSIDLGDIVSGSDLRPDPVGELLAAVGRLAPVPTRGFEEQLAPAFPVQSFTARSRNALLITLTDDSAMAAAAMAGDSNKPKLG
jgi:hypothetical protein